MSTEGHIYTKSVLETEEYILWHSCRKCTYFTKSMSLMRHHIKRHKTANSLKLFDCAQSTPEIFFCEECNFKTYITVTFNNHFKEHAFHASERTWQDVIQFSDKMKSGKDDHKEDHEIVWSNQHRVYVDKNNVKWFGCGHCGYRAKRKPHFKQHMIMRHETLRSIRGFYCDKCTFKTKRILHLRRHTYNRHTPLENIQWFCCDECEFKAKFKQSLKNHITAKHTPPENIDWFLCDKCGYKAKRKSNLWIHVRDKHTPLEDYKWFQCDHCAYKAKSKSRLTYHIKCKHTPLESVQWFHCDKCTYKSKHKYHLKLHTIKKHISLENTK